MSKDLTIELRSKPPGLAHTRICNVKLKGCNRLYGAATIERVSGWRGIYLWLFPGSVRWKIDYVGVFDKLDGGHYRLYLERAADYHLYDA